MVKEATCRFPGFYGISLLINEETKVHFTDSVAKTKGYIFNKLIHTGLLLNPFQLSYQLNARITGLYEIMGIYEIIETE